MLAKRIIPCLDIANGRVKKGVNFLNLKDVGDPVTIAAAYEQQGADELVFLDITATNEHRKTMATVVEDVSQQVFMPLTVGGGIQSIADMETLLHAGADKIAINSAAIADPNLITSGAKRFGSQAIVVAIDVKWHPDANAYLVYTHGGTKNTGLSALQWAQTAVAKGAGELLITSMDQDGTKNGFDIRLYNQIAQLVSVPLIASGGAGSIDDFSQLFQSTPVTGALAASVFHYRELLIPEVKRALQKQGVSVRI
ncbi:imidazole glycerol phosphate synthase subunit HisF (plasmid) [Nicoliella spurrieriana]|uniref:Imidazole glycerol phosphate synthase subunit HisF n=1 Tax=Nicoliella spurrieriana TaxID=2925830 RepID=A0A976RQF5_9LACO|nr:imidazole glycerol phosphate synthase subunit HisF [Nicoliella spurrieriana]UQS85930.1 imidazole glycerol phosphate synthase subunit HisF [Nicoliella spurrieriana]